MGGARGCGAGRRRGRYGGRRGGRDAHGAAASAREGPSVGGGGEVACGVGFRRVRYGRVPEPDRTPAPRAACGDPGRRGTPRVERVGGTRGDGGAAGYVLGGGVRG